LLDGGVEGIAVDVDNILGQIPADLEFRDETIGIPLVAR
jgi:hypothetical protein